MLVAGRHRLEAIKRRRESHIQCLIFEDETDARLWEISENLHRADLTVVERSEHEAEWMRLREADLQLEHGVPIESKRADKRGHRHESGIRLAARELPNLGKTEDAKRIHLGRSIRIAAIDPEAKEVINEVGLANATTALIEIARAPKEQQASIARQIAERRAAPKEKPVTADKALAVKNWNRRANHTARRRAR